MTATAAPDIRIAAYRRPVEDVIAALGGHRVRPLQR